MPYKKKRAYRPRKRYARRRFNKRRGTNFNAIMRGPVARRTLVRMRYCTTVSLDPSIGIVPVHTFRCGSIHDPDYTGVGHQPHGHDTYQALYNHYYVVGSKITATFSPNDVQPNTGNMVVGIKLDDDVAQFPSDKNALIEKSDVRYTCVSNGDARGLVTLKSFYSPKKFLGFRKHNRHIEAGAAFGSDPTENAFFRVFASPINESVDSSSINVQVEISYMVMLTEPRDVQQS